MKTLKTLVALVVTMLLAVSITACVDVDPTESKKPESAVSSESIENVESESSEETPNGASTYVEKGEDYVIITVSSEYMTIGESTKLIDYMSALKNDNALEYVVSNGMVDSIFGTANSAIKNSYWMIYTNDKANSNTAWGTYEYNGASLGSATLGATDLPVVDGCIYAFVYTKF